MLLGNIEAHCWIVIHTISQCGFIVLTHTRIVELFSNLSYFGQPNSSKDRPHATRSTFKVFGMANVAKPATVPLKLVYPVSRCIRISAFLRPLSITVNNY